MLGQAAKVSAEIGVLLVMVISAYPIRETIFSFAVRSYMVNSPSFSNLLQERSSGFSVFPSKTTIFIPTSIVDVLEDYDSRTDETKCSSSYYFNISLYFLPV